jgi:hypothetical protein
VWDSHRACLARTSESWSSRASDWSLQADLLAVHELLEQLKQMRQAIQGIPGLRHFSRRGEREDGEENDPR